jgi:manganese transport protein
MEVLSFGAGMGNTSTFNMTETTMNKEETRQVRVPLWRSFGPAFIIAAVVVGPGTITVSSRIGAGAGTDYVWALLVAGSFMMLFTAMAAKIGVLNRESLLTLVARHYGHWLAVLLGVLSFTVAAAFQAGNYLASSTALTTLTGVPERVWMAVVGLGALTFVFAARQLYKVLEKVMLVLIGVMVLAFFVNLAVARPNPLAILSGLVPKAWPGEMTGLMIAMMATTFSVIAAMYQSTLAQQKGWTGKDLRTATHESVAGIGALVLISLVVMVTAATVLRGSTITNAAQLAEQLDPLLGSFAVVLFSLGFFSAAFSSTIINAMVGGGLLADALGYKTDINAWPSRIFTASAMAVGLGAGAYTLKTGSALDGIVLAQKTTILAVPLAALMLILLANNRKVVGENRNSFSWNLWALVALGVLLSMSLFRFWEMLRT